MWRTVSAAMLTLCATAVPAAPLPVKAQVLWEQFFPGIAPVDLNRDSSDELLVYDRDNYVVVRDQQLLVSSASRRFTADTRRSGPPFAVNETLMWVPRIRNDSLFLNPLWQGREMFCFTVPTPRPGDYWDGSISELAVRDLDDDGASELVILVQAGFALWPRGVATFDLKTGQRRWFFETGPNPQGLVLRDVDGDGMVEVIFGSVAPGNGHEVPGSDDSQTYLFCLRHDGSTLWQRQVGLYGQTASTEWFGGRLLVHEQGHPVEHAEPDSIFVVDPLTGAFEDSAQLGNFGRGVVLVGDSSIISAATDDTVRVYDTSLNVVRAWPLHASGATGICLGSFTAQGRTELAVTTTKGNVRLYDLSMRLLAESDPVRTTYMRPLANKGRSRLLVEAYQDKQTFWRLYEFDPLPLLKRPVTLWIALAGIGLLLVAFLAVLAGVRYRQTRDMRAVVRSLTGQAGVVEIDRRGRLRRANQKGRELLVAAGASEDDPFSGSLVPLGSPTGSAGTARELPLSLPTGQTIIVRATSVKTGTLLTLEDISAVEYMKRVTSWAPVAQRLAHDIKNPLSTIRLKAQQMEEDGVADARTIREEVDRLSKMADGFARLANFEPLKLEPREINTLVRHVVEEQGLSLRPGLAVKLNLQSDLPRLNLDEEQLARALASLVTNAVDAMPGEGTLTIRTRTVNDGTHVALEVADTGPGIPEECRAKLFQPFFTRKHGGTGLGLTIARKVVQDHGGIIEVESELGKGSTFTLVLPAGKTVGTVSA